MSIDGGEDSSSTILSSALHGEGSVLQRIFPASLCILLIVNLDHGGALHNPSCAADYLPSFTLEKHSLYQLVSYKYRTGMLAGSKGTARASPMRDGWNSWSGIPHERHVCTQGSTRTQLPLPTYGIPDKWYIQYSMLAVCGGLWLDSFQDVSNVLYTIPVEL